jgi:hypothetical protein
VLLCTNSNRNQSHTLQAILMVEYELEDELKKSKCSASSNDRALNFALVRKLLKKPSAQWVEVAGEEVRFI